MNRAAVDVYTIAHFGGGVLAGATGVSLRDALLAAIGYEIVEQAIERTEVGRKLFGSDGPESLLNASVDVLVFMAGWWLARRV